MCTAPDEGALDDDCEAAAPAADAADPELAPEREADAVFLEVALEVAGVEAALAYIEHGVSDTRIDPSFYLLGTHLVSERCNGVQVARLVRDAV